MPPGGGRWRAVARIALGLAQVMAATVTLYLLTSTGTSTLTYGAAAVAGLLVLLSKVLFRDG
jgi:hypothetical protein